MTQPIYKVFMGRPTEAWYQLSPEEQTQLLARLNEQLAKVGGQRIVSCDSRWASDQWHFFGVEEFPDLAAVQQYHTFLSEVNWFRYLEGTTTLGTKST
jgi:hypothetical protein